MIRSALSFLMMIFGLFLAYGTAVFSPDAVAFLSSTAPGSQYFLPRFASLCAEPFVLYYGLGSWLWAAFFFGGGLRLHTGISPRTFALRFLAAHAAAFLLGLSAGLLSPNPVYQTAGVGGVLASRALGALMPSYLWLPFAAALLFVSLCFTSSLPSYLFYRLRRALTPRPLPELAHLRDMDEESAPEYFEEARFEEAPALPERRPVPDESGVPSFLRPVEVELKPEDYDFPKERSAFYEKLRENLLELDESSPVKASYNYITAPETLDETDGETLFRIPAEEIETAYEGGIGHLKSRPLARLSFDISSEQAAEEQIDPAHARRIDSLETDDTRFIPVSAPKSESPSSGQVKTFDLGGAELPPPLLELPPGEEGFLDSSEPEEIVHAGSGEAVAAGDIILPEDYESAPPALAPAEMAPEDTFEETPLLSDEEAFLTDGEETPEDAPLAVEEGADSPAAEITEEAKPLQGELAPLYFQAVSPEPETYSPEDIESYLDEEISSLKKGDAPLAPPSYIEPTPLEDEFFISVPEERAEEVPPLEGGAPLSFEVGPEELPAALSMGSSLESEAFPSAPPDDAYVFNAAPVLDPHLFPPALPLSEYAPIEEEAPKYTQAEVDSLVSLNDKVTLPSLLEDAADPSVAYDRDEVPFSSILSVVPDRLEEKPFPAPSAETTSDFPGEIREEFFGTLGQNPADTADTEKPFPAEAFSFPAEDFSEGDAFFNLERQIIQEAETAKEEFINMPVLEPPNSREILGSKISLSAEELALFSNLAPAEAVFSTIAPTAEEIEEFHKTEEFPSEGAASENFPQSGPGENLSREEPLAKPYRGIFQDPPQVPPEASYPNAAEGAPLPIGPGQESAEGFDEFSDEPSDGALAPPEAALMPRIIREEVSEAHPSSFIHAPLIDPIFPSSADLTPNNEVVDLSREDAEIDEMVHTIEQAFESFNVSMKVVDFSRGPAITRFELEPPPGLKLRTIRNLQDDIALQLGTSNIRIISPVEGRSYVGIEVPNTIRRSFLLKEFIEDESFQDIRADLPLILGTDIGTNKVCGDLTTLPHLLVAGTTGSGKSVYINALISGLLFKLSHNDLKFIMIDPKMVELELYSGIPHLLAPIITKPEEAMAALEWAVQEMDRRYKLLSDNGVRNIKEYRALASESFLGEGSWEHLPYIVIIVDEFANLMLRSPKETEKNISRLAAMARAVGIHLVIATQRPSVDVVTGIIKANFPCRIAFRVSSKIDSRTILDRNGAEALLGKGDMLYISPEYNEAERMQSPFVPGHDVETIVNAVKKNGPPNYVIDFEEILSSGEETDVDGSMTDALSDPMFAEVLRYAVDSGEVSASGIQRRFRVGYNRASRLIETLKDQRIISPPASAGKGWQVLITKDQIVNYLE